MGTALTVEQIAIARAASRKTVVVVFDGDTAGQRAAQKAIPLFVDADVDGRMARLPTGVDPDDFVRAREGAGRLPPPGRGRAPDARPVHPGRGRRGQRSPARWRRSRRWPTLLVKVRNPTTRELYAAQLAGVLRADAAAGHARPAARRRRAGPPRRRRPRRRARRRPAAGARRPPRRDRCPARSCTSWSLLATLPGAAALARRRPRAATCWSTRRCASSTAAAAEQVARDRRGSTSRPGWTPRPADVRDDGGRGADGRQPRRGRRPAGPAAQARHPA